jgi:Fic/DOC family N-terminal
VPRQSGAYTSTTSSGEAVRAFVPALLPVQPPVVVPGARLDAATAAIHDLDLIAQMAPSMEWLLYGFVRKEAVLSSQIEGERCGARSRGERSFG